MNNMKHKEDWTDGLRERLSDVRMDVPDMLWDNIEQKLDAAEGLQRRRRVVVLRRWAVAASIAVLFVMAGGLFVVSSKWDADAPQLAGGNVASAVKHGVSAENEIEDVRNLGIVAYDAADVSRPSSVSAVTNIRRADGGLSDKAVNTDDLTVEVSAPNQELQHYETGNVEVEKVPSAEKPLGKPSSETKTETKQPRRTYIPNHSYDGYGSSHSNHGEGARWNVGLGTSGNFGSYNNTGGVVPVMSRSENLANANTFLAAPPVQLSEYKETAKHNTPISFGLSAAYHLTPRVTVSTGVVYTKATSTFEQSTSRNTSEEHQTLHYVGVPLSVGYTVWGNQRVRTYVQAGAQADFNVKARVESDGRSSDVDKDKVQMSVGGAVGVQLNIAKQVGVYAEPGVKYYFDNGSHVQNIFKEHPCNFNLQIGLRYNIM